MSIAVASLVLMVSLFVMEQLGFKGGPYLGILTYLILPTLFVVGLALIGIGTILYRRRMRRLPGGEKMPPLPIFDLNAPRTRVGALMVLSVTVISIVILAGATYKGVEVMESVEFCGLACHSVMKPEHTAYQRSSHSRVRCAECHIGPGADWFVKSKLDGAWQLLAVAFDLYPRPIPTPLHDLRPARETCEQCHWPTRFVGDKLTIRKSYADDEVNTELTTAILLKVGGAEKDNSVGIHWHVDRDVFIRYRSNETREEIYEVEFTDKDGSVKVYTDRKAPEDGGIWRSMDCVDCHNRPSHRFHTPDSEIDHAIRAGLIDRTLPFVKRESLRIIDTKYASHEEARDVIADKLKSYYAENHPEIAVQRPEDILMTTQTLGDIYAENVFPSMKVWWNTYPDHIGHQNSPGCFRCHGKKLRTSDREFISRDCDVCHTILADEEENPQILPDPDS
jgi:nitrate/TMAO reductase-like tetraheme cytochrome c subunit